MPFLGGAPPSPFSDAPTIFVCPDFPRLVHVLECGYTILMHKITSNRFKAWYLGRLLCPDIVQFHGTYIRNIFTGTNTFKLADFKSEEFPLRRLAVLIQTAILCSLISQQTFSCTFNDTHR